MTESLLESLKEQLNERDMATVRLAHVYAGSFSCSGVPGHNLLLLVDRLATQLSQTNVQLMAERAKHN